jgi:hypothetical protein
LVVERWVGSTSCVAGMTLESMSSTESRLLGGVEVTLRSFSPQRDSYKKLPWYIIKIEDFE